MKSVGDPCPYCDEPLSGKTLMRKRRSAADNAHASRAKAKANGTKMGRPKKRDDKLIRELRRQGHSLRDVAIIARVSVGAVQRSIKDSK